jgi:hypothetical protein
MKDLKFYLMIIAIVIWTVGACALAALPEVIA